MSSETENLEFVTVVCPTCATRVDERVRDESYEVKCPDCFEPVTIPDRKTALKKLKAKRAAREALKAKQEEAGTYTLSAAAPLPLPQSTLPLDDEPAEAEAEPEYVLVNCPVCATRLHPEVKAEAYYTPCPDCHTEVRVPADRDIPAESKRKIEKRIASRQPAATADVPPAADDRPEPSEYFERREAIRKETVDPPPEWAFFSNVFQFPWMEGTRSRWIYMALLFEMMGLIYALIWGQVQQGSRLNFVAVGFFSLAGIWFTIWSLTYAAACFMPVLIDTAAGNDAIREWPEPNWREWAQQFFYMAFVGVTVTLVAFLPATAAELAGGSFWITFGVIVYVLYPIFLLSALETGSVFVPVSGPILKSLATHWWCWGMYYLEVTLLWGLLIQLSWLGIVQMESPYLTSFAATPLVAALALITARLLGRLAWRAGGHRPKGGPDELEQEKKEDEEPADEEEEDVLSRSP